MNGELFRLTSALTYVPRSPPSISYSSILFMSLAKLEILCHNKFDGVGGEFEVMKVYPNKSNTRIKES